MQYWMALLRCGQQRLAGKETRRQHCDLAAACEVIAAAKLRGFRHDPNRRRHREMI